MMKYSSGAPVGSRYLLVENITSAGSLDVQVWSALDKKTGEQVQGNFYKDGRIEWVSDKSDSNFKSRVYLFLSKIKLDSRLVTSIVIVSILLLVFFLYQRKIISLFSNKESEATHLRGQFNGGSFENEKSLGSINWEESAADLDKLEDKSGQDKTVSFVNSAQSFNRLRQYAVHSSQVDSLYNLYIARGNKCMINYQQENRPELKVYALNWLNLAFVLRPSLILEEYINRLGGKAMEQLPVPVFVKREAVEIEENKVEEKSRRKQKAKPNMSELFLKDPEIE